MKTRLEFLLIVKFEIESEENVNSSKFLKNLIVRKHQGLFSNESRKFRSELVSRFIYMCLRKWSNSD